ARMDVSKGLVDVGSDTGARKNPVVVPGCVICALCIECVVLQEQNGDVFDVGMVSPVRLDMEGGAVEPSLDEHLCKRAGSLSYFPVRSVHDERARCETTKRGHATGADVRPPISQHAKVQAQVIEGLSSNDLERQFNLIPCVQA